MTVNFFSHLFPNFHYLIIHFTPFPIRYDWNSRFTGKTLPVGCNAICLNAIRIQHNRWLNLMLHMSFFLLYSMAISGINNETIISCLWITETKVSPIGSIIFVSFYGHRMSYTRHIKSCYIQTGLHAMLLSFLPYSGSSYIIILTASKADPGYIWYVRHS